MAKKSPKKITPLSSAEFQRIMFDMRQNLAWASLSGQSKRLATTERLLSETIARMEALEKRAEAHESGPDTYIARLDAVKDALWRERDALAKRVEALETRSIKIPESTPGGFVLTSISFLPNATIYNYTYREVLPWYTRAIRKAKRAVRWLFRVGEYANPRTIITQADADSIYNSTHPMTRGEPANLASGGCSRHGPDRYCIYCTKDTDPVSAGDK